MHPFESGTLAMHFQAYTRRNGRVFLTVRAYERLDFLLANVGDIAVYAVHAVFSEPPAFGR